MIDNIKKLLFNRKPKILSASHLSEKERAKTAVDLFNRSAQFNRILASEIQIGIDKEYNAIFSILWEDVKIFSEDAHFDRSVPPIGDHSRMNHLASRALMLHRYLINHIKQNYPEIGRQIPTQNSNNELAIEVNKLHQQNQLLKDKLNILKQEKQGVEWSLEETQRQLKYANKVIKTLENRDAISSIERLCNRFHAIAKQLTLRCNQRPSLEIGDEYDTQDLLHALLKLFFDDIRPEEWTPSYAGKSSRMDFLLKDHDIVIEVKKTRKGLGSKEVGEQLIIDIERYRVHPNCKTLICFVYDPDEFIKNAQGLENDLNRQTNDLTVKVFVAPKRY